MKPCRVLCSEMILLLVSDSARRILLMSLSSPHSASRSRILSLWFCSRYSCCFSVLPVTSTMRVIVCEREGERNRERNGGRGRWRGIGSGREWGWVSGIWRGIRIGRGRRRRIGRREREKEKNMNRGRERVREGGKLGGREINWWHG